MAVEGAIVVLLAAAAAAVVVVVVVVVVAVGLERLAAEASTAEALIVASTISRSI